MDRVRNVEIRVELSRIGVFEKVRKSEEKWRDALVKMGQKKEKEGGQERSG